MSQRKHITAFGRRPHTVTVFAETTASGRYCRVQYRVKGKAKIHSWPDTGAGRKEAKAFAETVAATLSAPDAPPEVTLAALWTLFVRAEFDHLRPRTRSNYSDHWRKWTTFAGPESVASAVTRERVEEFAAALRAQKMAASQIVKHVKQVTRVLSFAVDRGLIPPTKATTVRVRIGKDAARGETAEYRAGDALAIIAALDPEQWTQWRAWAFCMLARYTGARANAILHLQWADIDLSAPSIIWRGRWAKTGVEWTQRVSVQVVEALAVAEHWRTHWSYTGPWVLFTQKVAERGDQPITYRAVQWMLHRAERKAGVAHVHMNAMHRFRRGLVGDIVDLTGGDVQAAMEYVGDTDIRQAKRYVKRRDERSIRIAELLSGAKAAPQLHPEDATEPLPEPETAA